MDLNSGYTSALKAARLNLKRHKTEIRGRVGVVTYRWARRLLPLLRLPGFLDDVCVIAYENLEPLGDTRPEAPGGEGSLTERSPGEQGAPILAFAHKNFNDVAALVAFMAGRPVERFYDYNFIVQGGVFTPVHPLRDLIPDKFKQGVFRKPALKLARLVAPGIKNFYEAIHGSPVFREGSDIPGTEAEYRAPEFSGPELMGLSYAEYLKFANRLTRESVIKVQREMLELNRSLIILPEGGYRNDGRVAPLRDFLAFTAYRKKRPVHLISLSYDELCPGRSGRLTAWFYVAGLLQPPTSREDFDEYLKKSREILQKNTPVLASGIIAWALRLLTGADETRAFTWSALVEKCRRIRTRVVAAKLVFDPGLRNPDYLDEKIKIFRDVYGKKYFIRSGESVRVNLDEIENYQASERTQNLPEYHRNQLIHIRDLLKGLEE